LSVQIDIFVYVEPMGDKATMDVVGEDFLERQMRIGRVEIGAGKNGLFALFDDRGARLCVDLADCSERDAIAGPAGISGQIQLPERILSSAERRGACPAASIM
jgi:hypothetical protein